MHDINRRQESAAFSNGVDEKPGRRAGKTEQGERKPKNRIWHEMD
jgi:hypothetical protein